MQRLVRRGVCCDIDGVSSDTVSITHLRTDAVWSVETGLEAVRDLQTAKLSKKQLCDSTVLRPPSARGIGRRVVWRANDSQHACSGPNWAAMRSL